MSIADQHFRRAIRSQYMAALEMMRQCVIKCSTELWTSPDFVNPFWRTAYHALFFFRLYMYQDLDDLEHWEHHRKGAQNLSLDPDATEVEPYSKEEILKLVRHCSEMIDPAIDQMDLSRNDSGFHWYEVSKVEHMMVNLRHLQHHVAQLQDRMRNTDGVGIKWVRADGQVQS